MGLPAEIPVAVGTIDAGAMHLGLGLNAPGDFLLILRNSVVVGVVTNPTTPKSPVLGATIVHPIPDRLIRFLATLSDMSALDWAQKALGGGETLETLLEEPTKQKQAPVNCYFYLILMVTVLLLLRRRKVAFSLA